METAQLVDRVGRMASYWERHRLSWNDQEWLERRKKTLDLHTEMETRLKAEGKRITDYGWCHTKSGQWKRAGEPDPPMPHYPIDWREFPDLQRQLEEMKRRESAGEVMAGNTAGYTPF